MRMSERVLSIVISRVWSAVGKITVGRDERVADTIEAPVTTVVTKLALEVISALPFSMSSRATSCGGDDNEGMNLVHQNAIRRLRSTSRCLRMNRTTSTKNASAAAMSSRSSQSDFSSAVMSCFEVPMSMLSTSCILEADLSAAVDDSARGRCYATSK